MYLNDKNDKEKNPLLLDYWMKQGGITEKININQVGVQKTYIKVSNINISYSNSSNKKLN